MKILHLPTNVGGNSVGLAAGERLHGLHSDVLVRQQGWLKYPVDQDLALDQHPKWQRPLRLAQTFLKLRHQYDVFHFNFGSSLLHYSFGGSFSPFRGMIQNQLELPFYPSKAKKFVTYNGCDARQKYPTMERTAICACRDEQCYDGICNSGEWDIYRQKAIAKMAKYVDHMWALNPDLLHFLPKEKSSFLPYTISHFQINPEPILKEKKLLIVHAPTNRAAKGSRHILEALSELKQVYPDLFEVQLVENVPHQQALEAYRKADLVIDQILIGWYGAFAVEVMCMGKPVIARIAADDLVFLPPQMALDVQETIISAGPSTIYSVLERCIHDRGLLQRHAEASLDYVRRWHHPYYVAQMTKSFYEKS